MAIKPQTSHRVRRRHAEDAPTGQFEEGRRGWKKCACLIHVSGTLGGKFNRRQTGKSDWDEAKAVAALWEAANSWNGNAEIEPEPVVIYVPSRITITDAAKVFLSNREGAGAGCS